MNTLNSTEKIALQFIKEIAENRKSEPLGAFIGFSIGKNSKELTSAISADPHEIIRCAVSLFANAHSLGITPLLLQLLTLINSVPTGIDPKHLEDSVTAHIPKFIEYRQEIYNA